MNPYAKFLGDLEPVAVLSESPKKLCELMDRFGGAEPLPPAEGGKWGVAEIVTHLVHSEINFAVRLRNALTGTEYPLQPFDQDAWILLERISADDAAAALRMLRKLNLSVIERISPDDLERTFGHPELGTLSVRTLLEIMAGHDLSHFAQIRPHADQAPISREKAAVK